MIELKPKDIVTAQDYFDAHHLSADKIAVLNYWGLDKYDITPGLSKALALYFDDASGLLTVTRKSIEQFLTKPNQLQKLDDARRAGSIVLLDDLLAMPPEKAVEWIGRIERRMEREHPDWRVTVGLKADPRINATNDVPAADETKLPVEKRSDNTTHIETTIPAPDKAETDIKDNSAMTEIVNENVKTEAPLKSMDHLAKVEQHAEKNGVAHTDLHVLKMIKFSDDYGVKGSSKPNYLSGNARDRLEEYGIKNAHDVLLSYRTAPLRHWGNAMDRDFSRWCHAVGLIAEHEFLQLGKDGIENFIHNATEYVSQTNPDWQNQLLREEQAVTAKTTKEYVEKLGIAPDAMDFLRVFTTDTPYKRPDIVSPVTLPRHLIKDLARKNIHNAYDLAQHSSAELAFHTIVSGNEMNYLKNWITSVHGIVRVDNYDTAIGHASMRDNRVPYESLDIPNFKNLQQDTAAYLAAGLDKARALYPDLDDRIAVQKALVEKAPKEQIGRIMNLVTPYINQKETAKIAAEEKLIEEQLRREDEVRYQARQQELTANNKKDWVDCKLQKMASDKKDQLSWALRESKFEALSSLSGKELKSGHVMLIFADVVMAKENEVRAHTPHSYTYGNSAFDKIQSKLKEIGLSVDMPAKFANEYEDMISAEIEEAQEATRIEQNRQKFAEQFDLNYKRVCMKEYDIINYHSRKPEQPVQEGQKPKSILFGL